MVKGKYEEQEEAKKEGKKFSGIKNIVSNVTEVAIIVIVLCVEER